MRDSLRWHNDKVTDLLADLVRVGVENGGNVKASLLEPSIVHDGLTKRAQPDKGHRPLAIQAQYPDELAPQVKDVVPSTLLAETAEVREVLANLGGADARELGKLC